MVGYSRMIPHCVELHVLACVKVNNCRHLPRLRSVKKTLAEHPSVNDYSVFPPAPFSSSAPRQSFYLTLSPIETYVMRDACRLSVRADDETTQVAI